MGDPAFGTPERRASVEAAARDCPVLAAMRGTPEHPMSYDEVEARAHDLLAGPTGAARRIRLSSRCVGSTGEARRRVDGLPAAD